MTEPSTAILNGLATRLESGPGCVVFRWGDKPFEFVQFINLGSSQAPSNDLISSSGLFLDVPLCNLSWYQAALIEPMFRCHPIESESGIGPVYRISVDGPVDGTGVALELIALLNNGLYNGAIETEFVEFGESVGELLENEENAQA